MHVNGTARTLLALDSDSQLQMSRPRFSGTRERAWCSGTAHGGGDGVGGKAAVVHHGAALLTGGATVDLTDEGSDGVTGVGVTRQTGQIEAIGVHVSRWVTTNGYALNVDLEPAPFTEWITACGLEDAMFTTVAREAGRPVTVDDVRPHAVAALAEVFGLELEELPAADGMGLWAQPVHAQLAHR